MLNGLILNWVKADGDKKSYDINVIVSWLLKFGARAFPDIAEKGLRVYFFRYSGILIQLVCYYSEYKIKKLKNKIIFLFGLT